MKHLLLILLSVSMCNVFAGGDECKASYDPRNDMRNYSSDGWYLGDDYQDKLKELASEVDRSLFPEFEACELINEQHRKCMHLQTSRKATYDAFHENKQQEAKDKAKSVSDGMRWFGF